MQVQTKRRIVAPRIGIYLGIFSSALISLLFVLMILEQLGSTSETVRTIMIVAPLGLYLMVALLAYATGVREYFSAGRGVPALLNGLAMSITCLCLLYTSDAADE